MQEGQHAVFKCSVRHTCPSHQPTLSWNHTGKTMMSYKDIGHGNWEAESVLTFTPTKEDDHSSITCTVKHFGKVKGEITATQPIFVKGIQYNFCVNTVCISIHLCLSDYLKTYIVYSYQNKQLLATSLSQPSLVLELLFWLDYFVSSLSRDTSESDLYKIHLVTNTYTYIYIYIYILLKIIHCE